MIAHLTGTIISKAPDHCIVDVNGVGYKVLISLATYSWLPETGMATSISIHTYVREDQINLFGFSSMEERALFQRLIAVSGVGPKTALAILSGIPAGELIEAIGSKNHARLSSIPGVGKKTADRIIVELKDRIGREIPMPASSETTSRFALKDEVISALVNLGYQRITAENALKKIEWSEETGLETAIKLSLKELARA